MGVEQIAAFEVSGYNSDLRSVRGVEVFRIGNWNGDDYTAEDLDEMIAAFGDQGYGVPLKLGHDEVSGGQAYGWVERIYRVGDTLKADFKDMPAWVFDWVFVQHAYDQVSIEIYFNLKRNGKTFKRALKAVALLGAETPAVSGLKPLREALFSPSSDQFEKVALASVKVKRTMPDNSSQKNPEVEALTVKLSESAQTVATLQAQLQSQATQMASLTQTLATLTAQNTVNAVTAKIEKCKVPALTEPLRHLYSAIVGKTDVVKFTAADGKVVDTTLEAVLDDLVAHVNKLTETVAGPQRFTSTTRQTPSNSTNARDAGEELAQKTREFMAANKLPMAKYGEAMQTVLNSDAELRARYNAMANGTAH